MTAPRPQPPPPVNYAPLPRARSAAGRWAGAAAAIVLILGACYLGGRALTERVRDRTPGELRAQLQDANSGLTLDQAIEQVNRLDANARREVMQSDDARAFIQRLQPAERLRFVEKTLDRGIQQQLERYRKMNKDERQAFVEDAKQRQRENRERMENLPPEEKQKLREALDSSNLQEMLDRAVKAYLTLTSSEERAELAPLFEGALSNLDHARSVK